MQALHRAISQHNAMQAANMLSISPPTHMDLHLFSVACSNFAQAKIWTQVEIKKFEIKFFIVRSCKTNRCKFVTGGQTTNLHELVLIKSQQLWTSSNLSASWCRLFIVTSRIEHKFDSVWSRHYGKKHACAYLDLSDNSYENKFCYASTILLMGNTLRIEFVYNFISSIILPDCRKRFGFCSSPSRNVLYSLHHVCPGLRLIDFRFFSNDIS